MNFGRPDYFKMGDWNALCWECGRKRKASSLKKHWQGYYVCPEHWEPRQPQDFVRAVPDIITPPWVQPPVVTAPVVVTAPFITAAPYIENAFRVVQAGTALHNKRLAAIKNSVPETGSNVLFRTLTQACWLVQCIDVIGGSAIVAEVGNNGATYGTGFTSDASNQFLGANSVNGEWITPDAGTTSVPVAVPTTSWRVEAFLKFTGGTDATGDFFSVYPVGGAVGSYHVDFGWGSSGIGAVLLANWTTTYSSGGGSVNGTMTRPNTTDWYHFAFQNDSINKLFALYLNGIYIWGHGGGGTQPWDAGTGLKVIFNDYTAKHNCGGAVIRCGLPANKLYGYPAINASAFTPPTTRLQRYI